MLEISDINTFRAAAQVLHGVTLAVETHPPFAQRG